MGAIEGNRQHIDIIDPAIILLWHEGGLLVHALMDGAWQNNLIMA
jgi:hypothetical protein